MIPAPAPAAHGSCSSSYSTLRGPGSIGNGSARNAARTPQCPCFASPSLPGPRLAERASRTRRTPPPRSPESADYFGSGEPSSRPTSLPTPGTSWPHNSTPTPTDTAPRRTLGGWWTSTGSTTCCATRFPSANASAPGQASRQCACALAADATCASKRGLSTVIPPLIGARRMSPKLPSPACYGGPRPAACRRPAPALAAPLRTGAPCG